MPPSLADEQAYLLHAYDCLAAMHERAQRALDAGELAVGRVDSEIVRWHLARRVAALSARPPALCFGRIDYSPTPTAGNTADEHYYVGRRHVEDTAGEPVVIDWRAPAATPFYRATGADPLGLDFRRRFLIDGETLVEVFDEDFRDGSLSGGAGGVPDPLLAELERARTGEMRDIVATIQAEQDVIIRSPLEETTVVQGGPGTGKTAVGLHRAAFLLFEHRERLERDRLLVVGPNRMFLRYISAVLPSLGETSVAQKTIEDLAFLEWDAGRPEAPAVAALKGDARMAELVRRALVDRIRAPDDDLAFPTTFGVARLAADLVGALVAQLLESGVPLAEGRVALRERALRLAGRALGRRDWSGDTDAAFQSEVRATREFKAFFEGTWPSLSAAPAVRRLLTNADDLARLADGLFDEAEQAVLLSGKPRGKWSWGRADLALLDEAQAIISGTPVVYGHVVVDEAQDLTAMELRMVARRARDRSITLLGDLAQATRPGAQRSWDDAVVTLEAPRPRLAELTLGYRVPGPVLDFANRLLEVVAPGVTASQSVRSAGEPPLIVHAEALGPATAAEVAALAARHGLIGVIAPEELLPDIAKALDAAGVVFADATSRLALEVAVTLLPPPVAKGLEFDATVVVEPAAIAGGGTAGLRLLYIALTRATQHLTVVHSAPLPELLRA